MDKGRLRYLLQQYTGDSATRHEEEEMFAFIKLPEGDEILRAIIDEAWKDETLKSSYQKILISEQAWQKTWAYIQAGTEEQKKQLGSSNLF